MRKWMLTLLIAIFALPFFSSAVLAETVEYEIKDGEYDITAKAINKDTGEKSGAASFINEDATLSIQDGEIELTLTIPHHDLAVINGLQIEDIEPKVKENDNAKYKTYKLNSLKSELDAQVQYEVPSMEMNHDVPFKYVLEGLDKLPKDDSVPPEELEEPETPEESEEPADEEIDEEIDEVGSNDENAENENDEENEGDPSVPEEVYTLNYESDLDLDRYFDDLATLLIKDGKQYIQMSGGMAQYIDLLTIDEQEVTWGEIKEDDTYTIQFEINSLSDEYEFFMGLTTPMGPMDHTAMLNFDESTKQSADVNDYRLIASEGDDDTEDPGNGEDPAEGDPQKDKEDEETETPGEPEEDIKNEEDENEQLKDPEKEDQLVPDKANEIDYVIKHETEDKDSAANVFFVKPAILLEKNGERYLQITVKGTEYINSLSNNFGELVFVKENPDGSAVYQLKIDGNLSDVILLDMNLTVPGIYNNQEHSARLVLDPDSLSPDLEPSDYRLVASTNENGPDGEDPQDPENDPSDNNGKTPEKPELGPGQDNNGSNNQNGETVEQETNPKTGDTNSIMLYVLLMIGSAIPLGIMVKRRFV